MPQSREHSILELISRNATNIRRTYQESMTVSSTFLDCKRLLEGPTGNVHAVAVHMLLLFLFCCFVIQKSGAAMNIKSVYKLQNRYMQVLYVAIWNCEDFFIFFFKKIPAKVTEKSTNSLWSPN